MLLAGSGCGGAVTLPDDGVDAGGRADAAVHSTDGELVESQRWQPLPVVMNELAQSAPAAHARMLRVEVYRIVYLSDGLRVKGYLIAPAAPGVYPGLIYNRGGNLEFGAIDDELVIHWISRFADLGYVVVASQYRGNAGGEGQEEFGGADLADVLNLVPLLETHPRADASRIGMYGHSRGGMMTYLALRQTPVISAAIVDAGVSDCFALLVQRPEMESVFEELVPGYSTHRDEVLSARSALRWPDQLAADTPLLLIHGDVDERVEVSHAVNMNAALEAIDHPVRLEIFAGGDHALSGFLDAEMLLIQDWMDRYVRDQETWGS